MVSAKKKSQSFNWSGISDNGDGTFTTKGKIEKRRLLKEFHAQGVVVRSHRNSDGSWTVTPVGAVRPKGQGRRRESGRGYRPQTRYVGVPRVGGERYVPYESLSHPRPGASFGPRPYAGGYSNPQFRGPSFRGAGQKIGNLLKERQIRKKEAAENARFERENMKIGEEKLKAARLKEEKEAMEKTIMQQRTTARLQRERADLEEEQRRKARATMMSSGVTGQTPTPTVRPYPSSRVEIGAKQTIRQYGNEPRRTSNPEIATRQQPSYGVRRTSSPSLASEQKPVDSAALSNAREQAIRNEE